CFPVLEPKLKRRIIQEGLRPYLKDNLQAWDMKPDGTYLHRNPRRAKPYGAQAELLALLSRSDQ
ncbi:MAG: hypothetical protein ACLPXB_02395, partial [Thiobacillaceae bacterium]